MAYIAHLMVSGLVVSFRDYKEDMDARTWSLIVLWKEAEIERNKPPDK